MPTKHEAVILALQGALEAHSANVTRETELSHPCPETGLINLVEGDPVEAGFILGAKTQEWQRQVDLEILVSNSDETMLSNDLDAALVELGTVLQLAEFGGLISYMLIGAPEAGTEIPMDNAVYLKAATVVVTLFYETSDNPMETYT